MNENHNYLPLKRGNTWNYIVTEVNYETKDSQQFTEKAIYNDSLFRIDFYRNNQLWSYAYWYNEKDTMKCCNGITLVDYSLLGCIGDSVQIMNTFSKDNILFQYCGDKFLTDLPNYKTTKCVRTRNTVPQTNGDTLIIIKYYGYKVGLIYNKQTTINISGKVIKDKLRILQSHQF